MEKIGFSKHPRWRSLLISIFLIVQPERERLRSFHHVIFGALLLSFLQLGQSFSVDVFSDDVTMSVEEEWGIMVLLVLWHISASNCVTSIFTLSERKVSLSRRLFGFDSVFFATALCHFFLIYGSRSETIDYFDIYQRSFCWWNDDNFNKRNCIT